MSDQPDIPDYTLLPLKELEEYERSKVEELKILIREDKDLQEVFKEESISDEFFLLAVRARRCRPNLALKMIKSLREFKDTKYPELFELADPLRVKHVLDKGAIKVIIPSEGPAAVVFDTAKWDTSTETFDELLMGGLQYVIEISAQSVEIQRKGIMIILDMSGFGFSHARQCSYSNVSKMTDCVLFGAPVRVTGCMIINSPYVFEKVYQVVKFAIPERFRSYVVVTRSDLSQLHEKMNPSGLPESLGGDVPEAEAWEKNLEQTIMKNQAVLKLIVKLEGGPVSNISN